MSDAHPFNGTGPPETEGSRKGRESRDREEVNDPPQSKRRRTAIACTACRVRKSRCNGKRPRCSMCENLDFECIYESSSSSVNLIVSKDHMTEVNARLQQLEAKVQRHEQRFQVYEKNLSQIDNPRSSVPCASDILPPGRHSPEITDLRSAGVQELLPEEALTDGMVITYADEEDSGYFGQTSNISLIRHISRAMLLAGSAEGLTSPAKSFDVADLDDEIVNVSRPASPRVGVPQHNQTPIQRPAMLNMLPSEADTRKLIRDYFSNTGRLFPYIHEQSFMQTYEEMKAANFSKVRRTWLGLLNIILAMASNASSSDRSAKERIAASDVFYQRALGLCQTQSLRGTSLETVQYLLLMSQYLQGTQKSVQTWAIHGLATKAALSIGLHSKDALRKLHPIEREYRKRTWFGCIILDRTLSMTFGRPMAIPEDYVRLPLPQAPEGYIPISEHESTVEMQSLTFFNATITLYNIMARIISNLYGGNLGCDPLPSSKDIASRIFQFEQEIDEWIASLPSCLRLISFAEIFGAASGEEAADPSLTKSRIILSLRCLNVQVLIYRPAFSRAIDRGIEVQTQNTATRSINYMETSHIQASLASAAEIIDIIHGVMTLQTLGVDFLGAWWFSLYYVINSALMIFGSLFVSSKHTGDAQRSDQIRKCRNLLAKAIEALHLLDQGNVTVARCAQFLEQMLQSLVSRHPSVTGFVPDPNNLASMDPNDARELDRIPGYSLHQQDGNGDNMSNMQGILPPDFTFDGMYGDGLELGQFFLGHIMEGWMDEQG